MPDNNLPVPKSDASGPISLYLSDALDLDRIADSDTLDLALKSDGPFAVARSFDDRVYLHLTFVDERINFSMVLSPEVARELAAQLGRCIEGTSQ